MALELAHTHVPQIQALASTLLDSRKPGSENQTLARELLAGFYDLCVRSGLDGLLVALDPAEPPADRSDLADHPAHLPALVGQLAAIDLDGGSPRNTKVKQLADAVVAALGLTLIEPADRALAVSDQVRVEMHAAVTSVIASELAVPKIRESIVGRARAQCEPRFHAAFDKIAAQLDERGMRMDKTPKVPLEALQAVQQLLASVRNELIAEVVRAAIDRARVSLVGASPEAAARLEQPVSLRLTPRDVAILRAQDPALPKIPPAIVDAVLAALTELVPIAWSAPERPVRAYSATQKFAVGDLVDHPKFGRGEVTSCAAARIEVTFADGPHTLVHALAPKS